MLRLTYHLAGPVTEYVYMAREKGIRLEYGQNPGFWSIWNILFTCLSKQEYSCANRNIPVYMVTGIFQRNRWFPWLPQVGCSPILIISRLSCNNFVDYSYKLSYRPPTPSLAALTPSEQKILSENRALPFCIKHYHFFFQLLT